MVEKTEKQTNNAKTVTSNIQKSTETKKKPKLNNLDTADHKKIMREKMSAHLKKERGKKDERIIARFKCGNKIKQNN